MSLRAVIDENRSRLSPADLAVVDVLLSHPTEAAFLPAEQVAGRAGVHVAAATRLAKKLGYTGYPQLRSTFQSELVVGTDAAERVRRRLDRSDDVLADLVEDEADALRALPRAVGGAEIDDVAGRILAARRTLVYARGNATVLGGMLVRRLRRFGLPVVELPGSDRDLAEELISLGPGDLVVALAFRRAPRTLPPLLATAEEIGTPVVLLTDVLGGAGGGSPTVLVAPRGSGREFQSLTAPMAVVNALVLGIARLAEDRTTAALRRLDDLLDRFDS
ncbi:Transcriptional regulator [Pseudonocardia sp. Ae168_Ps1]|uniref:MurR/RpiR family transcriptional regulator n=1 Tax=unclassified Pseudonocardia TaxID=2619320 RepID=UPI00094A9FE5|nr:MULTISPECIES: MurR/RpiR family transcriptional regulator [unclassified Pseudonocardia]OLL72262.1 Transcriptional regulator [Pseudonocardia sp. Ae150A_Ps1]OLL78232.1 Transcriptional regulator [Pseudonocardia sp. Ae168_Ps1]OLL87646.1 Transcriptional regulator [Pseudonocardia sp. Ae263_Ps1]OLL92327.1 Transcriptional regulator [Pseudonocardia sp. Ae356_Ps1]